MTIVVSLWDRELTLKQVSQRTGIRVSTLWLWFDRGVLTEARIGEYLRRALMRHIARKNGVNEKALNTRLQRGMSPALATTKPVRKYVRKATAPREEARPRRR